ncbi:MAG: TIGR02391 family protein [Promethearchaeota archaeon]
MKQYAENLRAKFNANATPEDLLLDRNNLDTLFKHLEGVLPKEIQGRTGFERHLIWMEKRLKENNPELCRGDIEDICLSDLPMLEKLFREWCTDNIHFDQELVDKVSDLLIHQEYDSAIRKAFVILKSRLVSKLNGPGNLDGADLVNHLFGKDGYLAAVIDKTEKQAMRDLLAGLYGVFRNKYGHQDIKAPRHETDAVLSMINYVLKRIDEYGQKDGAINIVKMSS